MNEATRPLSSAALTLLMANRDAVGGAFDVRIEDMAPGKPAHDLWLGGCIAGSTLGDAYQCFITAEGREVIEELLR